MMPAPDCYMLRPEEIEKHAALCAAKGVQDGGQGFYPVIWKLAGGDARVFNAMWSFVNFAHAWDDVLDESGLPEDMHEAAVTLLHDAVIEALTTEDNPKQCKLEMFYMSRVARWDDRKCGLAWLAFSEFFACLRFNPFVQSHFADMRAMLVMALTRSLDGDRMAASGDALKRALAPAVRCADVDVVFHMVYLARGWGALRECGKFREYDLPDEPTKEAA